MSTPHIAGYRFIAPVRDSSLSVTWKAVQTSLDRVVAIKVLYPAVASDEVQKRHFVDIARTVSRLRHPGFVQVFDVVEDAPQPFVVMEHVEGETLAERVAAQGPLPPALAARVVLCLAEALDHAWGNARLVLRNLKPTEVRFAAPTVPKIVDFGLAIRSIPATDCAALDGGHIVGTPQFIAPEQTRPGAMPDFRADMYALGATLYFLLTGRVPFGEMDPVAILDRQVNGQIPHPRAIDSRLPPAVCSLAVRLKM
jgi:serine/threonine-protein kinase